MRCDKWEKEREKEKKNIWLIVHDLVKYVLRRSIPVVDVLRVDGY